MSVYVELQVRYSMRSHLLHVLDCSMSLTFQTRNIEILLDS